MSVVVSLVAGTDFFFFFFFFWTGQSRSVDVKLRFFSVFYLMECRERKLKSGHWRVLIRPRWLTCWSQPKPCEPFEKHRLRHHWRETWHMKERAPIGEPQQPNLYSLHFIWFLFFSLLDLVLDGGARLQLGGVERGDVAYFPIRFCDESMSSAGRVYTLLWAVFAESIQFLVTKERRRSNQS